MKFRFQKSVIYCITLDMGFNCFVVILVDFAFVDGQKIKCNIIRVTFNGICKVLNQKWSVGLLNELEGKPESPRQDQNFDDLFWDDKFLVIFQELENVVVAEVNFGFRRRGYFSFV